MKILKQQEVYGQLTYKMSKNLSTYLRYGTYYEQKFDGEKIEDQTSWKITSCLYILISLRKWDFIPTSFRNWDFNPSS